MNLLEIFAISPEQMFYLFVGIIAALIILILLAIVFLSIVFRVIKEIMDEKTTEQKSFKKPSSLVEMKKIIGQIKSEGFRPADVKESKLFVESQGVEFKRVIRFELNQNQLIPVSKWKSIYFLPDADTNKDTTANWHIFVVKI